MATCKNCFHFEVCDSGRHIGEYIEDDGIYSDGVEKSCPTFRDSADVAEVKHGCWKKSQFSGRSGFYSVRDVICSECGIYSTFLQHEIRPDYYCPNCGAKMDGGEEE